MTLLYENVEEIKDDVYQYGYQCIESYALGIYDCFHSELRYLISVLNENKVKCPLELK